MSRMTIVESDYCTGLFADNFRLGKGFVFPYGNLDKDDLYGLTFTSIDPESHEEADMRLSILEEKIKNRDIHCLRNINSVRKPQLGDLAYIFNYILTVPDINIQEKFFYLLQRYPFFGFEKSFLAPGKGIFVMDPSFYKDIAKSILHQPEKIDYLLQGDPRLRTFIHDSGSRNNFQKHSLRNVKQDKLGLLKRLIGESGVRDAISLAQSLSVLTFESIEELKENPAILPQILNIRSCYNDLQIENVVACLSSPDAKYYKSHYNSLIADGVPYMQAYSSMGIDPEIGGMIYDEIRFVHDFWEHEPSCKLKGYTFGIIE